MLQGRHNATVFCPITESLVLNGGSRCSSPALEPLIWIQRETMGALTGLLPTLVAVLWTLPPGSLGEKCTSFRHLENGRTFFRYRGLYVTFACNSGYKMHGYRTNSCVSGQWSREPPVCVASGCPSPGNIQHGVTSVEKDGSWVLFSCDTGYRIHGPSQLYCKGQNWNSSKPVCKQSDIMSGWQLPEPAALMPLIQKQNRYASSTMKNHLQTHQKTIASTVFREAFLNPVLLANAESKDIHTLKDPPALDLNPMSHLMEELLLHNMVHTGRKEAPPKPSRGKVSTSSATTETFTSRSVLAASTDGHHGTTVGQTELMDILHREEVPSRATNTDPGRGIMEPADVRSISYQPHPQTHYEPDSTSQVSKGPLIPKFGSTQVSHCGVSPTVPAQSWRSLLPTLLHTRTESALSPPVSPQNPVLPQNPVSPQNPVFSGSTNNINTSDHGVNISSTTKTTRNGVNASATNIITINNGLNTTCTNINTINNGLNATCTNINTINNGVNATSNTKTSNSHANISSSTNTSYNGYNTSSSTTNNTPTSYNGVNSTVQDNGTYRSDRTYDQTNTTLLSLPEDDVTPSEIALNMSAFLKDTTVEEQAFVKQATIMDKKDGDRIRAKDTGPQSVGDDSGTLHNETSPYMVVSSKSDHLLFRGDADNLPRLVSLNHRPVCPYPPLPVHGTFYFRTVENPRPLEYKHYIQYACYAGYTLAHGNSHSYCLQGGRWSGVTPVCLEVTPCSLNNGGCSQLCTVTQTQAQCHCRPGFSLLEDQHTCTDVDECVLGQHGCQQTCVNTLGSFQCTCSYGYTLAGDGRTCVARCPAGYRQHSLNPRPAKHPSTQVHGTLTGEECVDINECDQSSVDSPAQCDWKCVNLPGSYRCICPRGYLLHAHGHQCRDVNECSRNNGGCSHVCLNHKGSYKCACPISHRLSPYSRNKCLPRKKLDTNP